METDPVKYTQDLWKIAANFNNSLSELNSEMEASNAPTMTKDSRENCLINWFNNNIDLERAAVLITPVIREGIELSEIVEQFQNDVYLNWTHEIEGAKRTRKAERWDMWKLWIQRTIRWVAGVIVAVLLYSAIAYAAEKIDFIKIPVKDWFTNSTEITNE